MTSSGIVGEVLTRSNYEEWKILTKNYLIGKNLWDVVSGNGFFLTEAEARRRNGEVLHIIQLSCGPEIFNEIKQLENAEMVWNHLAAVYGSQSNTRTNIRHGIVSDFGQHTDLYKCVQKGDWGGVRSYLKNQEHVIFWAPDSGRTILHVAIMEGHLKIAKGLVNLGMGRLVRMRDQDGNTALALIASYTGNINIAKCIVNESGDMDVLILPNNKGEIPLLLAADSGHKKLTQFLFLKTPTHVLEDESSRVLLFERCIRGHIFDVALEMLNSYPLLPTESLRCGFKAFHELAGMSPLSFSNIQSLRAEFYNMTDGTLVKFSWILLERVTWGIRENLAYGPVIHRFLQPLKGLFVNNRNAVREILKYYKDNVAQFNSSQLLQGWVNEAMLKAAKHGNVDFIRAMREANHDLIWAMDNHGRDIFSYAVLYRKLNVFQFMHALCGNNILNYVTDISDNNMLHLAAHLGPFSDLKLRPGAALQMQREIQWFKAVEGVMHPKCREARNNEGKIPNEIFIETHKELMKDGEKWAKETANTFAIVGVLVITVMFAAVFTVPGGYHQETGVPIFLNKTPFTVFIIADVVSLFGSITAVLTYIDLQTSRYAEIDFLYIPHKIMLGLGFLSISLVSMMVAFCAALAIVLQKSGVYNNLIAAVIVSASVPFTLLLPSQFRLLLEIFVSVVKLN